LWTSAFGLEAWPSALLPLECVAIVLFIGGYALRVWSKVTLGRHFTYEIQFPGALVEGGPYALLLHPSYTGFALEWGCLCAFWLPERSSSAPFLLAGAYAAMLTFLWVWRAQGEEAVMRAAFGSRWDQHIAAGRWRFIPGIV
jgi:protein-S-isoprenylcysteine O-methyltransferase Ste14